MSAPISGICDKCAHISRYRRLGMGKVPYYQIIGQVRESSEKCEMCRSIYLRFFATGPYEDDIEIGLHSNLSGWVAELDNKNDVRLFPYWIHYEQNMKKIIITTCQQSESTTTYSYSSLRLQNFEFRLF